MKKEYEEIFRQLELAGMEPMICDTPIPYYDVTVQAGIPTDPGYISHEGMMWMPECLAKAGMICMVTVRGESMIRAGIVPGDRVVVEYGTEIRDGDIVVAMIDGESTVKSFMTDAKGNKWLVPHNPDFDAIRLTEDMYINSLGKVVQQIKMNPRTGYNENLQAIELTLKRQRKAYIPSREQVKNAICNVAPMVDEKRKWYAVYRVLVDRCVIRENAYTTFVQWVEEDVPNHTHLPDAQDLPRVALYSFSKPVAKWEEKNAPVSGKRFRDYCEIARCMEEEL